MVTCSATTCRNRLYFILSIKTVTFVKKFNKTKRQDHNENIEIGVAAETSGKNPETKETMQ